MQRLFTTKNGLGPQPNQGCRATVVEENASGGPITSRKQASLMWFTLAGRFDMAPLRSLSALRFALKIVQDSSQLPSQFISSKFLVFTMTSTSCPARPDATASDDIDIEKLPPICQATEDKAQPKPKAPTWPRTLDALRIVWFLVFCLLVPWGCMLFLAFSSKDRYCRQNYGLNYAIAIVASWFAYMLGSLMRKEIKDGVRNKAWRRCLKETATLLYGYGVAVLYTQLLFEIYEGEGDC